MSDSQNTENIQAAYRGLAIMMGALPLDRVKDDEKILIPEGHIEDRIIEIMELNFHKSI